MHRLPRPQSASPVHAELVGAGRFVLVALIPAINKQHLNQGGAKRPKICLLYEKIKKYQGWMGSKGVTVMKFPQLLIINWN